MKTSTCGSRPFADGRVPADDDPFEPPWPPNERYLLMVVPEDGASYGPVACTDGAAVRGAVAKLARGLALKLPKWRRVHPGVAHGESEGREGVLWVCIEVLATSMLRGARMAGTRSLPPARTP